MLMKSKTNCTIFVVLYETNILSLVSQNLDIFYQIQTKCYRNSDTPQFTKLNKAFIRCFLQEELGRPGVEQAMDEAARCPANE
jgi:hypothetical protein